MPAPSSKHFNKKAFLTLASIGLLHRAAFIGFISSIVLYLTSPGEGFELPDSEVARKFAVFNFIGLGALILVGPLMDFLIPKYQRFKLGLLVSIIGYLLLLLPSLTSFMVGAVAIAFGSSIINVSIYPRLGELYSPTSTKRDAGFAGFNLIIEFAAAIATFAIISLTDVFGFKAAFIACAILNGLALIICFRSLHEGFQRKETLTTPIAPIKKTRLPLLIILVTFCFWFIQTMAANDIDYQIMMSSKYGNTILRGFSPVTLQTMGAFIVTILGLLFFILLYFKKWGDSLTKLSVATLVLGVGTLLVYLFSPLGSGKQDETWSILSILLILALAEVILTPIAMSFITKVSPQKYQNSLFGLFLFAVRLSMFASILFPYDYAVESVVPDARTLIAGVIILLMAIPLLLLRQKRKKEMIVSQSIPPSHLPE